MRWKCFKLRTGSTNLLITENIWLSILSQHFWIQTKPLLGRSHWGDRRKSMRKGYPFLNLGHIDLWSCASFTTEPFIGRSRWYTCSLTPSAQGAEHIVLSFSSSHTFFIGIASLGSPCFKTREAHMLWRMLGRIAHILGMWVWWGKKIFLHSTNAICSLEQIPLLETKLASVKTSMELVGNHLQLVLHQVQYRGDDHVMS